jgi:derlin-1
MKMRIAPATTFAALFLLASGSDARKSTFGGLFATKTPQLSSQPADSLSSIFDLRGGASKSRSKSASLSSSRTATGKKKVGAAAAEKNKKSAVGETMQKYNRILPLTRIYITMVGVATLLGLVLGEEMTQSLLALDPMRVIYGWEIWRPLTAASFIGPPSIGWLMSGYYLFEYGSTLERAYGTAQHLVFLISQVVVLSILSLLVGQPFFAPSVITAMLHVLSRSMPHQKVKWLVFTVPYWSLPYGLMATDVLQAQSAMAALPHILGIISGHFYHFHKFIWPKMGGVDWLAAPNFLVQRFDPDARKDSAKESVSKALKARKRNKGRKLGS